MMNMYHPYHLVTLSPWPLMMSFSVFFLLFSMIEMFFLHEYFSFFFSLFLVLLIMFQWWRDVVRESTFQGNHTIKVLMGLRMGMILFILSEVMFFVSFFWAYFHMFLSPGIEIGSIWPPVHIVVFNPYNVPLLNTIILLSSGFSITWSHYMILINNYDESLKSLSLTIFLGVLFTLFQYLEYKEAFFTISDSVYGSVFFMMTGFHGLHVIIGTIFISVAFLRLVSNHFSSYHHFCFEASSWYWHFVDVVWLFLYIFLYWLVY